MRHELKATCAGHYLAQARSWIWLHPEGFRLAYPSRLVNNIYLDTPQLASLSANLAGTGTRQKLRLRWYGGLAEITAVCPTLELKYKDNLLGGKKRFQLPVSLNLHHPWAEILTRVTVHLPPEWQLLLSSVSQPTLLNRYRREYYETPDRAIRATLDYQQEAYDQRLRQRPNLRLRLPLDDLLVIEVKTNTVNEARLEEVMAHFPLPRSRNSKYTNGLLAALYTQ